MGHRHALYDNGTVSLTRYSFGGYDDDAEIELPYTIRRGRAASFDDPGDGPEIEIEAPESLGLTTAERMYLEQYAAETHQWDD